MRKNDKGLTLVELIVVIAIMGVLVSAVGIGIGLVNGRPADKCATRLKSILQSGRITAKGKLDASWEIRRDDSSGKIMSKETVIVREGETTVTESVIGEKGVSVVYYLDGEEISLDSGALTLKFDRSSGALKPQADGRYCTSIVIKKAHRTRTITIDKMTGRVSLD